jgi:hypothetical protein
VPSWKEAQVSGERVIPIVWVGSEFARETLRVDGIEHGYAGRQLVFAIQNRPGVTCLHVYLPRPDGWVYSREEFPDVDAARARAETILRGFLIHLLVSDSGMVRKVS